MGKVCIEIPAGLLDPKESAETCAIRELKEETGYVGKAVKFEGADGRHGHGAGGGVGVMFNGKSVSILRFHIVCGDIVIIPLFLACGGAYTDSFVLSSFSNLYPSLAHSSRSWFHQYQSHPRARNDRYQCAREPA